MKNCIQCFKQISKYATRCRICSNQGKNNPRWLGGITKPKCSYCNKVLNYGNKTCMKHYDKTGKNNPFYKSGNPKEQLKKIKNRWKNKKYRNRVVKKIMKSLNKSPNKPEKFLNKTLDNLFPKEYKFVGNGEVIISGFNPDFININGQKKIIEMFGDYWHNLPSYKLRDKRRIRTYKNLGYRTLIIWEKELKDITKLEKKILIFNIK